MSVAVSSREELAAALRDAGGPVRFRGGGTKLHWGATGRPATELSTARLDRVVEHNAGDLTAVLEAGVPLERAQATFAEADQMLALDPPDPGGATIGGLVATGDSGPLRSRYGAARDLVVGVTVALSDGTVAKAGGKVIKNVAGYDLAKLFTGSFGTLGAILEVSVRLHPLPPATISAAAGSTDPGELARAARELSHAQLEHIGLDVRFGGGDGAVLVRFGGAACREQADAAARVLSRAGLEGSVVEDDEQAWRLQREGQRSADGTVVRVSSVQTQLEAVMAAAGRLGARLVGRVPLGLSWLRLENHSPEEAARAVEELRAELAPSPCVVLDAPDELRGLVEPWPQPHPGALELMRRVKQRFDPAGICNPGVFVGGI
ncbi:MAG TPA: FAD-binding oxidoreductase [Thermoleophilaceae bacterium]|nr:FAD-binding oxidoreductase [Thermoleophilaceae bacterium]